MPEMEWLLAYNGSDQEAEPDDGGVTTSRH
jgi:hypothetical protein